MHLRRIVVVTAVVASALLAARSAQAYCLASNTMSSGKCQAWASTAISYRVSSNLTDAALLAAIDNAFATWAAVTCTGLKFTKAASFPINTLFNQDTGVISIFWVTQQSELPSGMDPAWFAYSFTPFNGTGNLTSGAVAFNAFKYKWNATGGASDTFDLQNVMTYYAGMLIGLGDSKTSTAVMYENRTNPSDPNNVTFGQTSKRTLTQDDIDAVSALYKGTCAAVPGIDPACGATCTVGPPGPTPDLGPKKDTAPPTPGKEGSITPTGDGKPPTNKDGSPSTNRDRNPSTNRDGNPSTNYDGYVVKYDTGSLTTGCTSTSQCPSGQICSVDHVCVSGGGGKSCGCLVAGRPDPAPPALALLGLAGVTLLLLRRRGSHQ